MIIRNGDYLNSNEKILGLKTNRTICFKEIYQTNYVTAMDHLVSLMERAHKA